MPDRNQTVYDLIVCFSLVNLSFLIVWRELVFASAGDLYWMPSYTIQSYIAILLNVFGWTLILWVCLRVVRKLNVYWLNQVSRFAFLGLLVFPLNFARSALHIDSSTIYWLKDNSLLAVPLGGLVALGVVYLLFFRLPLVTKFVAMSLLVLAPFGIATVGQTVWHVVVSARAENQIPDELHIEQVSDAVRPSQRVVWLIFDELDLRLGFLDRPPGVELPELERFRKGSVFAINAESLSKNTEQAIPSFLFGQYVETSAPKSKEELNFYLDTDDRKTLFGWRDRPTAISESKRLGAATAIMGIYHPYCRIFYPNYSYCSWYGINTYAVQATNSVTREMLSQLTGITPVYRRINGVRTFEAFMTHAARVVADRNFDFVYIHASVPHGPDIYNERTGGLTWFNTSKVGYFGNLILADRLLGELRRSLERAGLWDSSTILLTADHEWRFVRQYDGVRTRKLPFLIKMPNQSSSFEVDTSFAPMLVTKDLILDILSGALKDPESVKSRLEQAGTSNMAH